MRTVLMLSSVLLSSCALAAGGDHLRFTQQYGLTFSEIGDPGNPDYVYERFPGGPLDAIGGVDHRYRIATTEVSVAQWGEFVAAYAPFIGKEFSDNEFSGGWDFAGFNNQGVPQYETLPELLPRPNAMGWRYAARYCNWLHNGKPTGPDVEQWVFETGAYDTSTFTENPDGTYNDQAARSPGARFFIPTLDEWVKAVHWDPERSEGEGDWRRYAYGDSVPIPGQPDEGGQTNATLSDAGGPFDVGSYPEWTTPWGLLDASGGVSEWLENPTTNRRLRFLEGTDTSTPSWVLEERESIEWFTGTFVTVLGGGLRIAAAVPTPGTAMAIVVLAAPFATQRSRRE
jgi:formylglycine-generating enzyme required for sulfatase activity